MLRLGVMGCGGMGTGLLDRAVRLGRTQVAAIYDPDEAALKRGCERYSAEPVASERGLAERHDVDAVLIASPGAAHLQNVLAAAPTGKPIYCEKPLCTTVERCDRMIEACRRSGSKLFVGQVLRLFPLFWESHRIVQSGALGDPRLISITRAGRGLNHSRGWRASFQQSGGLLLEVNAHEIDYMLFLMGPVESVKGLALNLNQWGDCDDAIALQIRFRSGGIGMLHSSMASSVGEYRVHLQCACGNLLHGGWGGDLRYQAFADDKPTTVSAESLGGGPDPYERELISFFDWVESDTAPLFTGETGRAVVAVAEAAYRSIESGEEEPAPA